MTRIPFDPDAIRALAAVLSETGLTEIEIAEKDSRIRIVRAAAPSVVAAAPLVAPGGSTPPAVNGGALIATVLRAVLDCSPLPHPVATSAHFLRVARLAPAEIEVTWLKQGRTAATARATLIQDGQPVLEMNVGVGVE